MSLKSFDKKGREKRSTYHTIIIQDAVSYLHSFFDLGKGRWHLDLFTFFYWSPIKMMYSMMYSLLYNSQVTILAAPHPVTMPSPILLSVRPKPKTRVRYRKTKPRTFFSCFPTSLNLKGDISFLFWKAWNWKLKIISKSLIFGIKFGFRDP